MAYDIIGNVVDSADKELQDVIVSDGVQSVKTNSDGYYELKTQKTQLFFSKNGFVKKSFDLLKYKNPSSLNIDITLETESAQDTQSKRKLSSKAKTAISIGISVVVLVGVFFVYRRFKKK